jgi:hypothetical protein
VAFKRRCVFAWSAPLNYALQEVLRCHIRTLPKIAPSHVPVPERGSGAPHLNCEAAALLPCSFFCFFL